MSAGTDVDESRPDGALVEGDRSPGDGTHTGTVDGAAPRRRRRPPAGWWLRADDWMALVILVACCAIVFLKLQPHLIFRNTTPNGGDLGAHVWWPAYLRDHLLPWRLAGWTPDFYAGFPAGQFYFPVPALGIVGLDTLLPYNIAFKVVVSLGPVLVPIGAYVFARGIKAPNPTPAAFAIAVTAFLFFTGDPGSSTAAQAIAFNQRIMGGNLASTLAGEFSFTLAIAFAFFFFGSLAWALRTRQHLWLPAAFLALCLMSHLMVGIFAGIGALAVWAFHEPIRNFTRAVAIGVGGVCLSAVWLLPLLSTMKYTTDMRYAPIGIDAPEGQGYTAYLFPRYFFVPQGWAPYEWGGYVLIAVAIVAAVICLRRSTLIVLVMTALAGLAFRFWTELGTHVWNLRLVSFWYFGVFLLMAIGVAELVRGGGWLAGRIAHVVGLYRADRAAERAEALDALDAVDGYGTYDEYGPVPAGVAAGNGNGAGEWAAASGWPAPSPGAIVAPAGDDAAGGGGGWRRRPAPVGPVERRTAFIATLVLTAIVAFGALSSLEEGARKSFLPYWAKWNFSGYENVEDEISGTYTQPCSAGGTPISTLPVDNEGDAPLCVYENRVAIGKQWPEYEALIGQLKQLPPGRSLWEGGPSLDKYGTPLALMLIPYWTDGKITTMEGVYFEASATTPYHFEAVAALVAPGQNSNPVRGIPYRTQERFDIGVRYLQALGIDYFLAHTPTTKAKADADPRLTKIASSPDVDGADPQGWSIYRVADAPLVQGLAYEPVIAEGVAPDPDGWEQQIAVPWWWSPKQLDRPVVADGPDDWKRADGAAALTTKRRAIADPATVSDVKATDDSISFRVDEVGKPVLVKASWFPNWEVDGAEGPYRATPNFMVVVPTEKEVTLRYGTTPAEWAGRLLTLIGFVGIGLLVWWGHRTRKRARAAGPDGEPQGGAPGGAEGTIPATPGA